MSVLLRSLRVVLPDGTRPADVLIEDGRIARILGHGSAGVNARVEDVGDLVVMPGLVDPHVHLNDPGRASWEGFETGTQAAAAGGVTTLVDMPLNSSPVTTDVGALEAKKRAAEGNLWVDVGFHAGVVPGQEPGALAALVQAGVLGAKAFMVHSGIDDFPASGDADLARAMRELAPAGVPLLVHAEVDGASHPPSGPRTKHATWLASRPPAWEEEAISRVLRLCRESRCPVHIVHLSAAECIRAIVRAKTERLPVTVETCPHYLFFHAEEIADGDTRFKCAPPIRGRMNNEQLWGALLQGMIDMIASDHSPCPPSMKDPGGGDFFKAWGGISTLPWTLPVVWTQGRDLGVTFDQLARWLSRVPADLAGLGRRKGCIAPGFDADLVVWEPDASFVVRPEAGYARHKVTPYEGRRLYGVIQRTYLRGECVASGGVVRAGARGRMILGRD